MGWINRHRMCQVRCSSKMKEIAVGPAWHRRRSPETNIRRRANCLGSRGRARQQPTTNSAQLGEWSDSEPIGRQSAATPATLVRGQSRTGLPPGARRRSSKKLKLRVRLFAPRFALCWAMAFRSQARDSGSPQPVLARQSRVRSGAVCWLVLRVSGANRSLGGRRLRDSSWSDSAGVFVILLI